MNPKMIKALTAAHGETLADLASVLGITGSTLADKASGRHGADFTTEDIRMVKRRYHLSAEQIDLIFFDE